MARQPDKFQIVHNTRDIEAAHIQGQRAVIWNSQTATVLNDGLWARGNSNDDLAKNYGANKMRVYSQAWEGVSAGQFTEDYEERVKMRNELHQKSMSR